MSEEAEPIPVELAVPVRRQAEGALRFFILSGMRIYTARKSEDSLLFLAVT
jgi:hypothetical protein